MITNNYTTLVRDGDVVQTILPGEEFDKIEAGCINTAHCHITDGKGNMVAILTAGMVTTEIKESAKLDLQTLEKSQLKELCIEAGLSFTTKATKQKLIDTLEA